MSTAAHTLYRLNLALLVCITCSGSFVFALSDTHTSPVPHTEHLNTKPVFKVHTQDLYLPTTLSGVCSATKQCLPTHPCAVQLPSPHAYISSACRHTLFCAVVYPMQAMSSYDPEPSVCLTLNLSMSSMKRRAVCHGVNYAASQPRARPIWNSVTCSPHRSPSHLAQCFPYSQGHANAAQPGLVALHPTRSCIPTPPC